MQSFTDLDDPFNRIPDYQDWIQNISISSKKKPKLPAIRRPEAKKSDFFEINLSTARKETISPILRKRILKTCISENMPKVTLVNLSTFKSSAKKEPKKGKITKGLILCESLRKVSHNQQYPLKVNYLLNRYLRAKYLQNSPLK